MGSHLLILELLGMLCVSVKVYKPFLNISSGWAWECVRLCRLSSVGNIMTQQWDLHQNRVLCASEAVPKKMAVEELRFFSKITTGGWRHHCHEQLPEHVQNNAGVGCEQALHQGVGRRGRSQHSIKWGWWPQNKTQNQGPDPWWLSWPKVCHPPGQSECDNNSGTASSDYLPWKLLFTYSLWKMSHLEVHTTWSVQAVLVQQ